MRDENLTCSVPEFAAAEQKEMEVVLRCRNDVCVGAMSVNFTMPYFMWFVSHFTVGLSRRCYYHLSFHCWLITYEYSL